MRPTAFPMLSRPAPFLATASALVIVAFALSACQRGVEAPADAGVCYQVAQKKDGTVKFNVVDRNVPTMETCIARLDQARYRFMALGSTNHSIVGAYGGKFLFIDQAGVRVSTTSSIDSGQFQAFARAPDGKLAIPSYIPQPGPTFGGSSAPAAQK